MIFLKYYYRFLYNNISKNIFFFEIFYYVEMLSVVVIVKYCIKVCVLKFNVSLYKYWIFDKVFDDFN